VNVVDSSGWLEYFADGPNAPFFSPAIEGARPLGVGVVRVEDVNLHRGK
jgi:hypothetical protein